MTLKPGKPQVKGKPKRKTLGKKALHPGDSLPLLSDNSGRTPVDVFPDYKETGATLVETYFAAEYLLNGFNATEAYRKTNTSLETNTCACMGSELLRRPVVQQLLHNYTSQWLQGKCFELEHHLMETLQALAFYDISTFLNPDGTLNFKDWNEIPVPLRRCVEGIEVKFFGAQAQQSQINIQLAKRSEALKAIASYVSIMRNGPLASASSNNSKVSAEAELVLSAVLNSGRKVDRRTPQQLRAEKAEKELSRQDTKSRNSISFSGLG